MPFSVIVIGGSDVKSIIDILKKLPDVTSIKILNRIGKSSIKYSYILVLPCVKIVDKILTKIIDLLEHALSKAENYDILILPLRPSEKGLDNRNGFRSLFNSVKRFVKIFIANLASSVSRVLVPELTYSALDLIVVRGDVFKKCSFSFKSFSSFLALIFQKALYFSEYKIYKLDLPIEVNLDEVDIPVQDIIKYVHIMFSTSDFRVLKFICVGLSGVLVNVGMLHVLHVIFSVPLIFAGLLAIESSIVNNFVWNSIWTFRLKIRRTSFRDSLLRFLKYHVAVGVGALVNYVILLSLSLLLGINYIISNVIGIGLGAVANYLMSDRFVWKVCRR